MARPPFKLDTSRLRSLREESLLTQREVAKQANTILKKFDQAARGKKFKSYEDTLNNYERSYQRTEQKGSTTKAMAAALAEVFKTTVEILQGGAPAPQDSLSVVNRIERQLLAQKELGSNLALQHALTQHDCIHEFAEDISVAIEMAQIGQNSSEIKRLAELTGWSEAELQQSGDINGHWLLLTTMHVVPEMKIVLGVFGVISQIQEAFEKKWIKSQRNDVSITLQRSLPWLHVEIANLHIPARRLKFSLVRSRAEAGGLRWVNPTWKDQFWLEYSLKEWAFNKTNFFTDFDGNNSPDDVRQLRFRVQERDADGVTQRVAYSKGDLEEWPEENFQNFKADGSSHDIAIIWLNVDGLAQSLVPHLTAYPPEYWSIRFGTCHIAIFLDIPYSLLRTNKELISCKGIKYTIDLVEETSPGVYQSVPWRDDSVAEVAGRLEKCLLQKFDGIYQKDALQFLRLPVSPS